jgi:hypothetical protein
LFSTKNRRACEDGTLFALSEPEQYEALRQKSMMLKIRTSKRPLGKNKKERLSHLADVETEFEALAGMPDFSWYNIPKREKIYQMTIKYTRGPPDKPHGRTIDQMTIKCTKMFH